MQSKTDRSAEELADETKSVAAEIEREVAGIMIPISNLSRNRIKVDYDEYLPPEVAEIARENGFVFEKAFGQRAVFKRE